MSTTLMIAIGAGVVVVVGILVVALFRRPAEADHPGAEATFHAAWSRYLAEPGRWSPRGLQPIEQLAADRGEVERAGRELAETVDAALAAPDPAVAMRKSIMDAADRFVMAEIVSGEGAAEPDYVRSVVAVGALRCFSGLRFNDFSERDWFAHYLKLAEMNARNVAGMVRKTVSGEASQMEASLHDPLMATMRNARNALLHHPPRTPVHKSEKLTDPAAPAQPYPSEEQVHRLTDLMTDRFEKLFSGLIYQIDNGPAVDPVAAFQIDAALLYALLAVSFRYPTDGWRQIMERSLGHHREAMRNEETLLDIGRACTQTWKENLQSGPLEPSLKTCCSKVFADSVDVDSVTSGMAEDATILIAAVQTALGATGPGWKV